MGREPGDLPAGQDVEPTTWASASPRSTSAPGWVPAPPRATVAPVTYPFTGAPPSGLRSETDDERFPDEEPDRPPPPGSAGRRALISLGVIALVLLAGWLMPASEPAATPAPTPSRPSPTSAPKASSPKASAPEASSAPGPSARAGVPAGFHLIRSTAGLRLAIPNGWTARPVRNAAAEQRADDPDHPLAFLQFGGYTTVHASQLSRVSGYEQGKQRTDYVRLKLNPVIYGEADDAVEWEYTFRSNVELHAYGRYWRVGGREYVLYALAPQADWAATWEVLRNALNTATPR